MESEKGEGMERVDVPSSKLLAPRFAEWNPEALARSTKVASLAWKLRDLNFGMVCLLILLVVCGFRFPGAVVGLVTASTVLLGNTFYKEKPSARVLEMKDPSSPVPCFPVDLQLMRQKRVYGEDHGIVSFVDGWLVYEGEDCSFSVKVEDVKLQVAVTARVDSLGFLSLRWGDLTEQTMIRLRPKGLKSRAKDRWGDSVLRSDLYVALKDWLRVKAEADGVSLFPPVVPHPTTLVNARISDRLVVWGLAGTPILCSFGFWVSHIPGFVVGIFFSIVIGVLKIYDRLRHRTTLAQALEGWSGDHRLQVSDEPRSD